MNATIEHNFKYHPPRGEEVIAKHEAIRAKAKELALLIDELLPPNAGREKASAITHCEQAMFWGCAGIARHGEGVGEVVVGIALAKSVPAELAAAIVAARQEAMELGWQIEKCGASDELTKASVLASKLTANLNELLP